MRKGAKRAKLRLWPKTKLPEFLERYYSVRRFAG
jgi:hypothetical protein